MFQHNARRCWVLPQRWISLHLDNIDMEASKHRRGFLMFLQRKVSVNINYIIEACKKLIKLTILSNKTTKDRSDKDDEEETINRFQIWICAEEAHKFSAFEAWATTLRTAKACQRIWNWSNTSEVHYNIENLEVWIGYREGPSIE